MNAAEETNAFVLPAACVPAQAAAWAARLVDCREPQAYHRQLAEAALDASPGARSLPFVVDALAHETWRQYRSLVAFAWCNDKTATDAGNMLFADARAVEFLDKMG